MRLGDSEQVKLCSPDLHKWIHVPLADESCWPVDKRDQTPSSFDSLGTDTEAAARSAQ